MFYQKCLGCNSEWNGISELEICPFCNKEFEMQKDNFEDIEAAFKYIFRKHGFGIIKTNGLISLLSDYAPKLIKERKVVKIAMDSGIYEEMLRIDADDKILQETFMAKAITKLNDEYLIDIEWAKRSILWLSGSLDWSIAGTTHVLLNHQELIEPNISETLTENKKQCVIQSSVNDIRLGNKIYLGSYPYAADNEFMKIEWKVINVDENVLLLSTKCIDVKCYSEDNRSIWWQSSDLREWCRKFYESAFTYQEKNMIQVSCVKRSYNFNCPDPIDCGPEVWDRIFILSKKEIEEYAIDVSDLIGIATPYAESKKIYCNLQGEAFWWIRTPGKSKGTMMSVGANGAIIESGNYANLNTRGIRPAMYVDKNKLMEFMKTVDVFNN